MARDAIAVYIDDASIRLLSIGGRRPRQWAIEPLEAGLVRDGFIVDEPAVAARIRTMWAKEQPGSQRVIAGISGINCLYRLLSLPELPKALLPEAVRREASRVLGVPLEQIYISWQTLPAKPGETLVYVAAAARTTVDSIIRTLKKANLSPYMMDIAPLALARSTAEPSALIVDLESASLDIVVKMGGMPEVIRSVSVARATSTAERLNVVRQELQRAVTFYNSSHPDAPVPDDVPILVAGDLGQQQDLWQGLLGRVERRVATLQPPVESPEGFVPSLYAHTVGLVLKQTAGRAAEGYSRINLNALPEVYIPKPRPMSQLLFPPALLVGALAIAAVGYMLFTTQAFTQALRDRAEANNQLVTSLGAQITTERKVLEQQRDSLSADATRREARAETLDSRLRSFAEQEQQLNADLGEIHRTPSGVNLDTISYGGSVANLNGWGDSESAVFNYARQLRASGKFTLVVITSMRTDDVQTAFEMVLYK